MEYRIITQESGWSEGRGIEQHSFEATFARLAEKVNEILQANPGSLSQLVGGPTITASSTNHGTVYSFTAYQAVLVRRS